MSLCYEILAAIEYKSLPILIFMKDGKLLKTYGNEINREFTTIYYLPVKENNNCYILKVLVPVNNCGQFLLKETKTTITVNKKYILGIHLLSNAIVVNDVILRYTFHDFIKGDYKILRGFQQAIIWQSNTYNYVGKAKLKYSYGDESSLSVNVKDKNNKIKGYKLPLNASLTIRLKNVNTVEIIKRSAASLVAGNYSFNIRGEINDYLNV